MASAEENSQELHGILAKASHKALSGGIAGMSAQAANVLSLMWARTIMNYQYRHGGSMTEVASKLYAEGGLMRFYRGLAPAMVQAPLARFGDTAANDGMLSLLETTDLSLEVKSLASSASAATFRILLMPIDAWKTTKQVEGKQGLQRLLLKMQRHPTALWQGSVGAMSATMAGHYPWFYTNNKLSQELPSFDFPYGNYVRNAMIGFTAATVSDTISNSLRVLKTTRQTSMDPVSYLDAARQIIAQDGLLGLLGRGLITRILINGAQGALFTVMWRAISERIS